MGKTMFSLVSSILLFSSLFVANAHNQGEENASKPKSLFILAGQSNMAGRAGAIYPCNCPKDQPPPLNDPIPSILRLTNTSTWEEAKDPLHDGIDTGRPCGVGPGMSFAKTVSAARPDLGVMGLIPCAKGGTKILEWVRGTFLYNRMINRTREALSLGGGSVKALLWFQGENDVEKVDDAQLYRCRFEQFVKDVRADLQLPQLPVVMVVINTGNGSYIEQVRQAQLSVDIPYFARVDSKGQPVLGDKLHYDVQAQVNIGVMLANAYLGMKTDDSASASAAVNTDAGVSFGAGVGRIISAGIEQGVSFGASIGGISGGIGANVNADIDGRTTTSEEAAVQTSGGGY